MTCESCFVLSGSNESGGEGGGEGEGGRGGKDARTTSLYASDFYAVPDPRKKKKKQQCLNVPQVHIALYPHS